MGKSVWSVVCLQTYIHIYMYMNMYLSFYTIYRDPFSVYIYIYIYIYIFIWETEMANFCLFPANGNRKRKFDFLGQQTMNGK